MASSVSGSSETTVTGEEPPLTSSIDTSRTPGIAVSSVVTCCTQWPQVMPSTEKVVVWLMVRSSRGVLGGGSAADETGDGVGGLADLLGAGLGRLPGGVDDAVAEVVLDEADAHGLQRLRDGGDLREDVDAVDVLVDHAGDTADLALDAAQALEVVVLLVGVAVHGSSGVDRAWSSCRTRSNEGTPQGYSRGGQRSRI